MTDFQKSPPPDRSCWHRVGQTIKRAQNCNSQPFAEIRLLRSQASEVLLTTPTVGWLFRAAKKSEHGKLHRSSFLSPKHSPFLLGLIGREEWIWDFILHGQDPGIQIWHLPATHSPCHLLFALKTVFVQRCLSRHPAQQSAGIQNKVQGLFVI